MSATKHLRSSRSKSRGRQKSKEPTTATSNTNLSAGTVPHISSPARVGEDPKMVNNAGLGNTSSLTDHVSTSSQSKQEINQVHDIPPLPGVGTPSPEVLIRSDKNPVNDTVPHPTSTEVSDNRALNNQNMPEGSGLAEDSNFTDPSVNLSREDPGRAILLVLAELKEIKTQMVELGKIESTTATLAEQLPSTIAKTGVLEKAVTSNKSLIEELSKDHYSLKKKPSKRTETGTRICRNLRKDYLYNERSNRYAKRPSGLVQFRSETTTKRLEKGSFGGS